MILRRDLVILVDEQDKCIGTADKQAAHYSGMLHRALSVFIINSNGEIMLQQRAADKYHSGGLWSNACCSHPAPDEPVLAAAHRRMIEELGFDTELAPVGRIKYRAAVSAGLIEHEYDYLFTGQWDGDVRPVPEEVSNIQWIMPDALDAWLHEEPTAFTAWFPILLAEWRKKTALHTGQPA